MSIAPPSKFQHPAFRVLWSSKACENLQSSLQIRAFTSHSYRILKEREGKREHRRHGKNKGWHVQKTPSDRNEHSSGNGAEPSYAGFGSHDGVTDLTAERFPSRLEEESTRHKDAHDHDFDVLGGPRRHECETPSVDASSRTIAVSLIPPLVATSTETPGSLRRSCDTIAEPNRSYDVSSRDAQAELMSHDGERFTRSLEHVMAPIKYPAEPKSSLSPPTGDCATSTDFETSECQIVGDASVWGAAHCASEKAGQPGMKGASVELTSAESVWSDASQKSSCRGRRMGLISHNTWTEDADERLFHLRDVAQLDWRTLVPYFPGTTSHGIRERYQQLKKAAAADQAMHNHRSSPFHGSDANQLRSDPLCRTAKPSKAKTRPVQSATQAKRKSSTPRCPVRCQRRDVPGVPAAPTTPSTYRDMQQRTSRRGRTIRHPFRNRLSEGYL